MDIFFLAILTFYIFYKLSKHLGKIDEEEKSKIEQKKVALIKMAQEKMQEIIKQEKFVGSNSTSSDESQLLQKLDSQSKSNLEKILKTCKINLPFFLTGAKTAFEMVLKAFSNGDLITLKSLVSEKIYQDFENAINQRKQEGKLLVTNLIAIEQNQIIAASQNDNIASVTVEFISKQINYISDKNGEVIFGNKSEITEVIDKWTFKRDITSPNPNWQISAT